MKFDKNGDRIVISTILRTPIGQAGKSLSEVESFQMAHKVVEAVLKKSGIDKSKIDGVLAGEIGQSSKAPNIARVVSVMAGLPMEATAVTLANNCVSSLEATNAAARRLMLDEGQVYLVFGTESMSNMAVYLDKIKQNPKTGNVSKLRANWADVPAMVEAGQIRIVDGVEEGLTDPATGALMIETGEIVAQNLGLSQADLDKYAHGSYKRAYEALVAGKYDEFLLPMEGKKGVLDKDEYIMSKNNFVEKPDWFGKNKPIYEMMPGGLKAFYEKNKPYLSKEYSDSLKGAVTLFNACPQSDGAAAMIVTTESKAKEMGLPILAYIKSWGNYGVHPAIMGLGIAYSMNKAVQQSGLKWDEIDFFEVHEAFASTAYGSLVEVRDKLGYDLVARYEKGDVNRNGGTLALGHPLGATGLRMIVNQLVEFKQSKNAKYSLSGVCAGGGVGGALLLERGPNL